MKKEFLEKSPIHRSSEYLDWIQIDHLEERITIKIDEIIGFKFEIRETDFFEGSKELFLILFLKNGQVIEAEIYFPSSLNGDVGEKERINLSQIFECIEITELHLLEILGKKVRG